MSLEPKKFWSESAEWWVGQDAKYKSSGANEASEQYLMREIQEYNFESALEIGAGTGRLIGRLSNVVDECHSVDINKQLCELVKENYPKVTTHNTPANDLSDFKDNSIDFVYTFQCLQHVPPEDIDKVLSEIFRVAKKEVWLMEGIVSGLQHGDITHSTNGGSYVYYYDQLYNCYEKELCVDKVIAYRIKL